MQAEEHNSGQSRRKLLRWELSWWKPPHSCGGQRPSEEARFSAGLCARYGREPFLSLVNWKPSAAVGGIEVFDRRPRAVAHEITGATPKYFVSRILAVSTYRITNLGGKSH